MTTPRTVPQALAALLRTDPGRPVVTFYDDATGERVELSATTFANWVAKTCGLLVDELDLQRGDSARVELPAHWLTPVVVTACWSAGLRVLAPGHPDAASAELLVCGPGGWQERAGARAVLALSLRPMGARFVDPLPEGVVDYGAEVLAQPDAWVPLEQPVPEDAAWADPAGDLDHAGLLGAAASRGRVLTDTAPATSEGLPVLAALLAGTASAVWVANPDPAGWEHRAEVERATTRVRTAAPQV